MNPTTSTDCRLPAAGATEQVGLDLAREMRRRWRGGERPTADEFLSRRPDLLHQPEAAVELIYEEYCLRQAAGAQSVEEDIFRRFPQWAGPLRVMLDCHRRLLQSERERPRFPEVGDRVGEFKLISDLARGAQGRVFIATQSVLADRPVVLKITPVDGGEHLSLARLQHTNIVPLYSVFDDDARNVRVLCMPYFGRATLASLMESLRNVPVDERSGRDVVAAIDGAEAESQQSVAGAASAAKQMLVDVTYVQAMCWIMASLADALQFAHERGVVHLDLKPSNVLLASDGQPMLLDFHLAREPILPGARPQEHFGGTPPYMPPEQHAAMTSLREGRAVEVSVDARADVYALGVMLYEALGGQLPVADDSPLLRAINSNVSRGLSDIVAKSVSSDPKHRYASAERLADDLRRHLTDLPLAGVPNRSLAERWAKWRRRRPATLRTAAALALIATALVVLAGTTWGRMRDRREQAQVALAEGQRQLGSGQVGEAVATFERGLKLVEGQPFQRGVVEPLREQLAGARQLQLAEHVHRMADEIRVLYGAESIPPAAARALAKRCETLWGRREALRLGDQSAAVSSDLQDIAIFAAHVFGKWPGDRPAAVRILDEVAAAYGPSAVVALEREALGVKSVLAPRAPQSSWEHYTLGRALLASGDVPRATQQLSAALALDPAGHWPNFYYGLCAYRAGRYEDAVAAYSVCIGSAPDVAGCFYNRALAYAALGRATSALNDYDRALQLDPTHAAAALNRGMLHFQHGRIEQATADLRTALSHGADAATVHYDLALVHASEQNPTRAMEHVRLALESNPGHEPSRQLRDSLRQKLVRQ